MLRSPPQALCDLAAISTRVTPLCLHTCAQRLTNPEHVFCRRSATWHRSTRRMWPTRALRQAVCLCLKLPVLVPTNGAMEATGRSHVPVRALPKCMHAPAGVCLNPCPTSCPTSPDESPQPLAKRNAGGPAAGRVPPHREPLHPSSQLQVRCCCFPGLTAACMRRSGCPPAASARRPERNL